MRLSIRKLPVHALLGAALLLAACEPEEVESPGAGAAVEPLEPPQADTMIMRAPGGMQVLRESRFQATPAAEGAIGGTLQVLIPATGQTQGLTLEARVEGLSPGPHAWHVYGGPCGEEAPVTVAISPTEEREGIGDPLEAGPDGVAQGSVFVPEAALSRRDVEAGGSSVRVHRGAGTDHGPAVACAGL